MGQFRPFEEEALRLLASPVFGPAAVEVVISDAELVAYEYSGVGYFLTVKHPFLPATRAVISRPVVIGRAGDIQGGYLVFVENGELTLECYTAGRLEVPADFRSRNVRVTAT